MSDLSDTAPVTEKEIDDLVNELKTWVSQKDISQSDLARMLGVTRQRVNDWFIGKAKPNLQAWLKINAFLRKQRKARNTAKA
jgi:predicted XRE-type DNA-binding protein